METCISRTLEMCSTVQFIVAELTLVDWSGASHSGETHELVASTRPGRNRKHVFHKPSLAFVLLQPVYHAEGCAVHLAHKVVSPLYLSRKVETAGFWLLLRGQHRNRALPSAPPPAKNLAPSCRLHAGKKERPARLTRCSALLSTATTSAPSFCNSRAQYPEPAPISAILPPGASFTMYSNTCLLGTAYE